MSSFIAGLKDLTLTYNLGKILALSFNEVFNKDRKVFNKDIKVIVGQNLLRLKDSKLARSKKSTTPSKSKEKSNASSSLQARSDQRRFESKTSRGWPYEKYMPTTV